MSNNLERIADALEGIEEALDCLLDANQHASDEDSPDGRTGMEMKLWIPFGNRLEVEAAIQSAKDELDKVEMIAREHEEV